MHTFQEFSVLLEFLTDAQRAKYAKHKMTAAAKAATDPFFGKGNDEVREELQNYDHDKSEPHKKVEQHLGREISIDDYKKGVIKDKYGRDVKIGRQIKDEKLRNEFATDNTRANTRKGGEYHMSIVRGTEVAGQTNPHSTIENPFGHSWAEQSCKNIEDGENRKFLKDEIRHGTVVARVRDKDNQEIYRATLQPHHNDEGHTAYSVNSEYGVKHPAFTAHAQDVAKRLSGEHKGGSAAYLINDHVYNDKIEDYMIHPKASHEDISKALESKDSGIRKAVASHPNATKEHLDKAIKDESFFVREGALNNPNANREHVERALRDEHHYVRLKALNHPLVNHNDIGKALDDNDSEVRQVAAAHNKATPEHISKALTDKSVAVRTAAISNTNASEENITKGFSDEHPLVREYAVKNDNANEKHIAKALNDSSDDVRGAAVGHPKANMTHIAQGLADESPFVRRLAREAQNRLQSK